MNRKLSRFTCDLSATARGVEWLAGANKTSPKCRRGHIGKPYRGDAEDAEISLVTRRRWSGN